MVIMRKMPEEKIQFTPHQREEKSIKSQKSVRGAGFTSQEKEQEREVKEEKLLKSLEKESSKEGGKMSKGMILFFCFIVIIWGVGTGYFLAKTGLFAGRVQREVGEEGVKKGMIVGVTDERTFRDEAEGELEEGGINGEGSHHLVRPGGESQNVYLTSSIIDLGQFTGRKVRVWGETFAGQKAGWLMDVGKLEVLE